jgi:hypothetical protein
MQLWCVCMCLSGPVAESVSGGKEAAVAESQIQG